MSVFKKDPEGNKTNSFDWTDWLNGATISTSAWTLDTGLTEEATANTDQKTSIVYSGGTAGSSYKITNRIVDSDGIGHDQSFYIRVMEC